MRRLKKEDRVLLKQVTDSVQANPFADERVESDLVLAQLPAGTASQVRLQTAVERVRHLLDEMMGREIHRLTDYGAEDRDLLSNAHLFCLFHASIPDMDRLIERQLSTGEGLCEVRFGAALASTLEERGFSPEDAVGYVGMFYQLRRAYYFIERALVGRSPSMRRLRRSLWDNVFTRDIRVYTQHLRERMEDFSTFLLGETGSGKGAAAAAIGRSGFIPYDAQKRRFEDSFMRNFIEINLSQFSEGLIESELFGHRKGAFTGAVEAHEGVFAMCRRTGAIFLDEIGDVSIPVQIKLLRVLQDREFSPVGSHEKKPFEGRVIAASNRPIDELRQQGSFRNDFFYRLCSDMIVVPPLRERLQEDPGELEDLLQVTVRRIMGGEAPELVALVLEAIHRDLPSDYPWPGNVRELEQCVRRVVLTHGYEGDYPAPPTSPGEALASDMEAGTLTAQQVLEHYCDLLYRRIGTYEGVARVAQLDRRTVRKYVENFRGD